jgi:hypothetical protein
LRVSPASSSKSSSSSSLPSSAVVSKNSAMVRVEDKGKRVSRELNWLKMGG